MRRNKQYNLASASKTVMGGGAPWTDKGDASAPLIYHIEENAQTADRQRVPKSQSQSKFIKNT